MLVLPLFILTSVSGSLSLMCHFVPHSLYFTSSYYLIIMSLSSLLPNYLILHLSVSLCLGFGPSVTLFLSSSLVPHQVTVGTGLRSPMAPAQGACGSSCSTPRLWAPGHSSSRPSPCIEAPSPRSCCQRSISSQVGLWAAQAPISCRRVARMGTGSQIEEGFHWERHCAGRELYRGERFDWDSNHRSQRILYTGASLREDE